MTFTFPPHSVFDRCYKLQRLQLYISSDPRKTLLVHVIMVKEAAAGLPLASACVRPAHGARKGKLMLPLFPLGQQTPDQFPFRKLPLTEESATHSVIFHRFASSSSAPLLFPQLSVPLIFSSLFSWPKTTVIPPRSALIGHLYCESR